MKLSRSFLIFTTILFIGLPAIAQTTGDETAKLKERVKALESENEKLKLEVTKLKTAIFREVDIKWADGWQDQVTKQVDFTKEYVVVCRWVGVGDQIFLSSRDKQVYFHFVPSPGGPAIYCESMRIFAVAKDANWNTPTDWRGRALVVSSRKGLSSALSDTANWSVVPAVTVKAP